MTRFLAWCAAILLAAICAIGAFWGLTIEHLMHERAQAQARAQSVNANLAVALEEHAIRTIGSVEQILSFVVRQYRIEGRRLDLPKLLRDVTLRPYLYSTVAIADADGHVILQGRHAAATIDVGDRAWFATHRDSNSPELVIGAR